MSAARRKNEGFMTETEIQSFFKVYKSSVKRWIKVQPLKAGHKSPSQYNRYTKLLDGVYDYDTITDEWFRWYLKRNNGQDNVFQFGVSHPPIYFVEALPFRRPYFRSIKIKQRASLLVPIYSFSASSEEYPSLVQSGRLLDLIRTDLSGIRWNTVNATLDGEVTHGYCAIRDKAITFDNFPANNITEIDAKNSISLYHGGFWLLIRDEDLSPGDHLLSFSAESKTFELEAKILINAMY
jgi:hypothetical protein